jgi:nicotinate-nucleotide adenylyltransferase
MTRIGIFGGSFDPPHNGHLLVVQDAMEAMSLDHMLIIPAATQPLKRDGRTGAEHRLAMVERCFAGLPGISVDPIEVNRGGLSFMVDTVEALQGRWPGAILHLLVGDDVVATLPGWREPARLLSMVHLVVLRRGLASEQVTAMLAEWEARTEYPVRRTVQLATRQVDMTSTEIRTRVREGKSIAGFVPDAVAQYIQSAGLYSAQPAAADDPGRA